MSEVDIIMPNYNKADYLDETINSIIKQDFNKWKLYIIDGFSNDNSFNVLKKYEKENKIKNLKYLWLINKNHNKFNFFDNLISIFFISYNSFKKYGFK